MVDRLRDEYNAMNLTVQAWELSPSSQSSSVLVQKEAAGRAGGRWEHSLPQQVTSLCVWHRQAEWELSQN